MTLRCLRFHIPPLGVGTYELRGSDCTDAVRTALQLGYRLIDTAAVYRNEELVGEGIAASGVPRSELFVVVKIAMKSMGSDAAVREGILSSICKLRIDYADCVLMHWPGCGGLKPQDAAGHQAARARCWRIMTALQVEGKIRCLGVSNFLPRHFAALHCFEAEAVDTEKTPSRATVPASRAANLSDDGQAAEKTPRLESEGEAHRDASPQPILNQVELHPLCVQRDVDAYCRGEHGMLLQQYSPLGKGDARLLRHPKLIEVHQRYFATRSHLSGDPQTSTPDTTEYVYAYSIPDILLMWGLSQGYCTLIRSHKPGHLKANLAAATDYFRSLDAVSEKGDAGGAAVPARERPLLSPEQLEVIHNLRRYMGVEAAKDVHLCWYSSEIA